MEESSKVPALDEKGRFTVARVTMTNWETNRYLRRLAKACGINKNRIFSSGLKDKRAITTQVLVIDAHQRKVEQVSIPDSTIEVLGRTHQKASMGGHDGNRFTITVRGCCDKQANPIDAKEAMLRVRQIREGLSGKIGDDERTRLSRDVFPIKPGEIVAHLDLKKPRYRQTAAYGHFGRELEQFTWEKTDMVDALLNKS